MKKFLSVCLVLALALTPALAATGDLFPAVNAYGGGFADVAQGTWYADAVRTCYEAGLMNGTGGGNFTPEGTMTVAEAATIAARIREAVTGEAIPNATPLAGQTKAWYDDYVNYLIAAGVSVALPTQRATRAQFFAYLSAVVPQSELTAINAITALPDTDDAGVLAFYNAGVLTGTDQYGTFNAAGSLSRAECAAMVARIIRPALRQSFVPQEKPAEAAPSYQEELDSAMAMLINGRTVSMSEFVNAMDRMILETDRALLSNTGRRLDWSADYGVGDLGSFFIQQTKDGLVRSAVREQQAKALGCTTDQLAQRLSPDPSYDLLSAYAAGLDYLAAKHILIQTYDPSTKTTLRGESEAQTLAQQIIDALDADPTIQQFQNLSELFNDDPGMTSYPEGYLFQSGEMVSEFEQGVRDLEINGYSDAPVKSVYGYHVILRLDPAQMSQLKELYQSAVLDALTDNWMEAATVTANDVMLSQLDPKACYEAFLALLTAQAGQS